MTQVMLLGETQFEVQFDCGQHDLRPQHNYRNRSSKPLGSRRGRPSQRFFQGINNGKHSNGPPFDRAARAILWGTRRNLGTVKELFPKSSVHCSSLTILVRVCYGSPRSPFNCAANPLNSGNTPPFPPGETNLCTEECSRKADRR
jgi:hypothetical protein